MNIYHAEPANFCGYVKGDFPDNVTNVTASGQHRDVHVQQGLQRALDPLQRALPDHADARRLGHHRRRRRRRFGWLLQCRLRHGRCRLHQGVHLPVQRGRASTRTTRARRTTRCPTYATNPLWQVVDGPWKLKAFNADGQITFVPNPSYSGPIKPTLKSFTELPYTSRLGRVQCPGRGQPQRRLRPDE